MNTYCIFPHIVSYIIYCGGNKFKFHPALFQNMYSFNVIPSLLSFICFLLWLLCFTASWTLFWEIWPATLPRGRSTSRCWWPCLRLSFAVQRTCTWGTSTWLYHRWSVLMLFCYMSCSLHLKSVCTYLHLLQQISLLDGEFCGALHQLQRETQQEKQIWSCFYRRRLCNGWADKPDNTHGHP